jgi:FkbM family methyltransferase
MSRHWRVAIDVGAHCGLWSMHLVKRFQLVHAFEPVAAHRECFRANVAEREDRTCVLDLSPRARRARGHASRSIRRRRAPATPGSTARAISRCKRLDDFRSRRFADVDFIKLDCEGYELFALRGGEELLKRCRPCVIVEQKPGRAQKVRPAGDGAVDYLQSLGAKLRREMSGDFIMSWD